MKYSLAKEINAFVKEKVTCFFCQSIAYHYIKLTGEEKVKKTRRKMNDKEFSGLIRDAIGLALKEKNITGWRLYDERSLDEKYGA